MIWVAHGRQSADDAGDDDISEKHFRKRSCGGLVSVEGVSAAVLRYVVDIK